MPSVNEVDAAKLSDYINRLFINVDKISSVEQAAQILAKGMCDTFKSGNKPELVLSRLFHSFEYRALPQDIQEAAKKSVRKIPRGENLFLTLIGTYGVEPSWQDRAMSCGHKAIPLTHEAMKKTPMMARLFQQVGFNLGIDSKKGSPGIIFSGVGKSYGAFYVSQAQDSPYIPDQDFVAKYGVKSVFGSAVKLPDNDISIYIGFSRVEITEEQALCFLPLMSLFWQKTFPLIRKGFFNE